MPCPTCKSDRCGNHSACARKREDWRRLAVRVRLDGTFSYWASDMVGVVTGTKDEMVSLAREWQRAAVIEGTTYTAMQLILDELRDSYDKLYYRSGRIQ